MTFALFFLAEYSHIILMSLITVLLFFGGWLPPLDILPLTLLPASFWLAIKTALVIFTFVWVRGSFPRMRYDQLMALLWKSYLPLSLGFLIWVASLLYYLNALPLFI
jgi:NADH:ubiquinone oxidoreductase subunit H